MCVFLFSTHIYICSSSTQGHRMAGAYHSFLKDCRQGNILDELPVYHRANSLYQQYLFFFYA